MPQLVPFYFINQVTFAFIILVIMIYVFSKYILPSFVKLFLSRTFITKLQMETIRVIFKKLYQSYNILERFNINTVKV